MVKASFSFVDVTGDRMDWIGWKVSGRPRNEIVLPPATALESVRGPDAESEMASSDLDHHPSMDHIILHRAFAFGRRRFSTLGCSAAAQLLPTLFRA